MLTNQSEFRKLTKEKKCFRKRIWSRQRGERRNHVSGYMTLGAPRTRVATNHWSRPTAQTDRFRSSNRRQVTRECSKFLVRR